MQAACGAGLYTFTAADAFRRTGNFIGSKLHRTGFFTGHAGSTTLLLPVNLYQAETVKPPVDSPQRTEILAERTVYLHGKDQNKEQHP